MENLLNGFQREGQSLETTATIRLPKRPHNHSNPNPKAFEDFGSSLAPRSSQEPARSKFKPAGVASTKPTRLITIKKPLADFSESEDELDLLSSSQADPDDFQPPKKVNASKYLDVKGKEHDYDPNFLPSKSSVLSKIKFTKTKKSTGQDNTTTLPSSSSKNQPDYKENGQDFGSWVDSVKNQSLDSGDTSMGRTKARRVDDDDVLEMSGPLRVKNRRLSSPQPPPKQSKSRELPNTPVPPRPRPRPIPLPARKLNADAGGSKSCSNGGSGFTTWSTSQFKSSANNPDGLDLIPLGRPKAATITTKKKNPSRSPSPEIVIATPTKTVGPGSQPQNFPMDVISPLGDKVQQKPLPKPRPKISRNTANSSSGVSRKLDSFPIPSPQSSDTAEGRVTSQAEGKNKALPFPLDDLDQEVEEDDDDHDAADRGNGKVKAKGRRKPLPKPRAFPMPTQMLASIGSPSVPKGKLSKHRKRISEGRSDEGQAKKKRRSLSPSQYTFEEGDSITIAPDTDPRTLCPYCDTPLPSSPSPLLVKILAATRKKSTSDPRPSNPLGLKAPLAIFIVACQRHKFESQILPEAERKGWPKNIQWHKLGARVERMRDELQALINDPGGERELDDVDEDIDEVERLFREDDARQNGPKARSIFWTEVMDEVKKKGLRAVVGVRGQFANFEKTQPGYYGEQGSVIIHQTLFDMFPPASFDPARISPLTSNEFVLRILVPEVALRLIMEDRDLEGNHGMRQALIVLRESSAYGVAMFPEDGGELGTDKKRGDDVMGVGDKIVMERARKRRKELEAEEEEEEREAARRMVDMEAGVETEEVKEKKTEGRKRKEKPKEDQHPGVQQAPVGRPRPRPRPIMKASSSMSVLPPSDHEEAPRSSQPSARYKSPRKKGTSRSQSRSRSMYSGMDTDRSSDFGSRPTINLSASESDDYHRPTLEERRRSPSASEATSNNRMRKPSSTRAASRGLAGLNIGFESDASAGSRASTKSAPRKSSHHQKSKAIRRSDSTMDMDLDDLDEDTNLEVENVLDMKTPVHKHKRSSNHRGAEDTLDYEQTPKPLTIHMPGISGSNDIRPLVAARMRQAQKNDAKSKLGGADMPRRTPKFKSDEWAPNMRAIHAEDTTDEEVEVVASPGSYNWLLNDTSQSSMEGSTSRRRH